MFDRNWNLWKRDCLNELREKFKFEGGLKDVEITEDGRVFFKKVGMVYLTDPVVTPWDESVHFVE